MADARSRLEAALRAAAESTPPHEITASLVARLGGVHRVTFYRHWPDVESALVEVFADEIDHVAGIGRLGEGDEIDVAELAAAYDAALRRSLEEIQRRRAIYRLLFTWPPFMSRVLDAMTARARVLLENLERAGVVVEGGRDGSAAAFIAGAAMASLAWWASSESEDAQGLARALIARYPLWWPRVLR
ncbi:hypothetical protein ACL02T_34395 [Pseudonocardia sp. RS010]|uniref:hypothetical protein n=1 Tax=Pseudonocardia sp. RS010 TaxID=3385979 RepID=UPI0039A2A3C6